jgi:hypothetical protein
VGDEAPLVREKPITWRDIFDEILKSEDRIKLAIKEAVKPVCDDVNDHERRLRELEVKGSTEAREALAAALSVATRVTAVELVQNNLYQRRAGLLSALSAGQKTLLVLATILGLTVGVLDLMSRLAT